MSTAAHLRSRAAQAHGQTPNQAQAEADLPHLPPYRPLSKSAQSEPDHSRSHSLPLHFLPPGLWSGNTSTVSLAESDLVARGDRILDEAAVARRIAALRQLNGANGSRHRYAKSTGARNTTFSQPVIVRTYPVVQRARTERRDLVTLRKEDGVYVKERLGMDLKLPPIEAFSFKGIMDEIRHGVTEDMERIAEICARSKYSLSNQYEVHMPPHGHGDPSLQTVGHGLGVQANGSAPSLHTMASDDELPRHSARGSRGGRRNKSVAYGTLETIMSSSKSSEEDKSKKQPAAVIAEEVRGRAARLGLDPQPTEKLDGTTIDNVATQSGHLKHVRSRSAAFATMVIENAHGAKNDAAGHQVPLTSLLSEPARPKTSVADLDALPIAGEFDQHATSTKRLWISRQPSVVYKDSNTSTVKPETTPTRPSILNGISSWFTWSRQTLQPENRALIQSRRASHAEGSLRELLRSTDGADRKGKGIDRGG